MTEEHSFVRHTHGGTGIEGWIQPLCYCGWKGSRHYAHNDYQHSNAREQWEAHRYEVDQVNTHNSINSEINGSRYQ